MLLINDYRKKKDCLHNYEEYSLFSEDWPMLPRVKKEDRILRVLPEFRHRYGHSCDIYIDISENLDIITSMNILNVLKALANEKRLNILEWLKDPRTHFSFATSDVVKEGVCVGHIERKSGLSQSTVSQYLLQLQQAQLITMERRGQWTYCKLNKTFINGFLSHLGKTL